MNLPIRARLFVAFALFLLVTACSTSIETRTRDWTDYTGPGAEVFQAEEVPFPEFMPDPWEPMNRGTFGFNDWVYRNVLGPVGTGWRFVFPKSARERIGMFGENLAFPVRGVNSLVQGKFSGAGTETARFLINTTVGVLGFFDPADSWGIEAPPPEDTGLSLEAAGWEDSRYLVLPVMGPNDGRDAVGLIPDTLLDIGTWIPLVPVVTGLNAASDLTPKYETMRRTSDQPYALLHALYTVQRTADLVRYRYTPDPTSGEVETLQAIFLAPRDGDFHERAEVRTVRMPATGEDLPYDLWLQPGSAPIVFVLPGTGSHRESMHSLAVAEILHDAGYSAVTVSSPMNWEFMALGASTPVPGYAPVDAHDMHVALDLIAADIERAHPARTTTKGLFGLSLGALHTLFIAAADSDPDNQLIRFDGYMAGASPVSLEHAARQLDRFYNAPLEWPADVRIERMEGTLAKAFQLGTGDLTPGEPLPFSRIEAEYLIGLDFRFTMIDVIWNSQRRHDLGVLKTPLVDDQRGPAYREISDYSFLEYFYAFALPYYLERDPTLTSAEDMFFRCNLRSLELALLKNPRIRVMTNQKDWLQSDEDRAWQSAVFGNRFTIWPSGGHLGNAPNPEARRLVLEKLAELIGEGGSN